MDALPLAQEIVTMRQHFFEQAPHVGPLDAHAEHRHGRPASAKQVDLRVSRPGYMDMGRFVVGCVDDEPKAMGAMDDDHRFI
jgi:hypothetical protein